METDRKTRAEFRSAKLKAGDKIRRSASKSNGKHTEKKRNQITTRPKTSKGRPPGIQKVTRRAQEELIGTQQRLLATYEHAPIGIIECSPDGGLVNVNKEFCRITGYDKEELLALSLKDLTYEEDYIFDIKMHQRLIAGEIPYYKLEKRYVRKDSQIIWVELTRNVVRDSNGKALFTIGVVLDVTDRKLAEEALQFARDQAERTADRITRLQKVTAALSEALTPSQVAEIVVEQGAPALGAVTGTVMTLAEDGQTLEIVHSALPEAITRPYQRFSISLKIPAADAARSGQPVWIESRQQYLERYPHLADQIAVWGHEAAVAVPMVDKGQTLGVLALSFDRILAYTLEDQDYALTLARQGAQALERARLYEAEQQARHAVTEFAQRQEVLYRLADQLHHAKSLEDVFHSALDAILGALQCDRASILLFDDTDVMRFVAWRGLSDGYRQATEGHSPWKPDGKDPEPISFNDIGTAEISDSLKAVIQGEGIGSLAFIPLVSNGKLIGKFMVYFNAAHVFSEGELDLSLTIARQLAFGIDRKRAQEALRESEERFRALVSQATAGIAHSDMSSRFTFVNPKFCEMLGYPESELLGKTVWELTYAEDLEQNQRLFERMITQGESYQFEKRFIRRDGSLLWTNVSVSAICDLEGKPKGGVGVVVDISARKSAEQALRESEQRYRTLFEKIDEGFCVIEKVEGEAGEQLDFLYVEANPAFAVQAGVSGVVGKTIRQAFPGEPEEWFETYHNILGTGEPMRFERGLVTQGRVLELYAFRVEDGTKRRVAVVFNDITERKQAEEALRASEERYRNLFDLVPIAVYTCDANGLIQEYNHRAVELWGREPEKNNPQEKYCGSFRIYYPDGRFMPHEECPMSRVLGGETLELHELEVLVERPDGVRRNVIAHPLPLKNEYGEIVSAINCLYDITERKQAEGALRESEGQFRAIVNQATAGIVRKDAEGRLIFVNQAFCEMLGYDETELVGKTVWQLTHNEDVEENKRLFDRLMVEGMPFQLEKRLIRRDNSILWVNVSVSPVPDALGRPQSAVAVEVDITGRKQAEEALQQLNLQLESRVQKRTAKLQAANQALRESETTARMILDTAPDAVVITDEAGRIVRVNAQIESLFGYQPDEVLGKPIETLIPQRFHERHVGHRLAYQATRYRRTMGLGMQLFGRRKDDSEFPVDVMLTPIATVAGWDVMVTIRDITERKYMEDALRESRERLQILSRRLVEVQEEERRAIARELHDRVGQTLAALNINLIIMNSQLLDDSKQRIGSRLDDSMHLTAEAMALVRDVMTDLRPAVLDDYGLEAALQSYIDEYRSRYGIQVLFEPIDARIPRLEPGLEMTLLRIAQEALTNVARHAQADQVQMSLRLEDSAIYLSVQDNGIGIESRPETDHLASHGLKIMRERAEAFGGSVNIESTPGKGTRVEARISIQNGASNKTREVM